MILNGANIATVPANRDDVVSGFVRAKIRAWRASGREIQELAKLAGFGKSTPSQVLKGTGVGAKTGPKFAKALGYASYDDLRMAAFEWWKGQASVAGRDPAAPGASPARDAAVAVILGLGQGTKAQIDTILTAYAHPLFLERDKDWWVQTLLMELALDRSATTGQF